MFPRADEMAVTEARLKHVLTDVLGPLKETIDRLDSKVDELYSKVDGLDSKMGGLDSKMDELAFQMKVEQARSANSRKGLTESLERVPRLRKNVIEIPDQYPRTLQDLVVGGSELAPNTKERSRWNMTKSRELIKFYDDGYISDHEGSDDVQSSREKRLRVARIIGVSANQMGLVAQASFA